MYTQYHYINVHGDVVVLTNTSGNKTKSYSYNAFGVEYNEATLDDNPFRYCGEYYDKETKTIYLRARYYNAEQGRFTQEDPIRDGFNWYAFLAKKAIQNYVFMDGYAADGMSTERRFVEDLDAADEVCVYAKLPKGFHIPTPVGNYSPDWAIAFNEGTVKHIYFIAETKGTMDSLQLKPIEQAKISCAKKLFNELSSGNVKYHDVDSYQSLLAIMKNM